MRVSALKRTSQSRVWLLPLADAFLARLFEEVAEAVAGGERFWETYQQLREYNLFQPLFSLPLRVISPKTATAQWNIIARVLKNTDNRIT